MHLSLRATFTLPLLSSLVVFTPACGDDGSSASASSDPGESESSDPSSESGSESTTDDGESDSTETGVPESSSETGETDDPDTTEGTGGEAPACDGSDPEVASWLLDLDGVLPDDLPEDAEENCAIVDAGPSALSVDCPSFAFTLDIVATPAPELPAPTDAAIVRVHHEPGWLNWPDIWIDVEVPGVEQWAFQSSSALIPTQGDYSVPWGPVQTDAECGPFLIENMFGADNCGEQVGYALEFDVDGAPVLGWHATHLELDVDGRAFEAWMGAVREYIDQPEFCDTSPTWFSLITRRVLG